MLTSQAVLLQLLGEDLGKMFLFTLIVFLVLCSSLPQAKAFFTEKYGTYLYRQHFYKYWLCSSAQRKRVFFVDELSLTHILKTVRCHICHFSLAYHLPI